MVWGLEAGGNAANTLSRVMNPYGFEKQEYNYYDLNDVYQFNEQFREIEDSLKGQDIPDNESFLRSQETCRNPY